MFEIKAGDGSNLIISGRFDATQVEKAKEFLKTVSGEVTADCSDLEYISSAGIGVLVVTQKRLLAAGHEMRLADLHPSVRDVFHYAGLERIFKIS